MQNQKDTGVAYLLWFFLGVFGGHQFYLGKTGRAVSYLLTCGWLGIGPLIDLFTLPSQVRQVNTQAAVAAMAAAQQYGAAPGYGIQQPPAPPGPPAPPAY